MSDRPGRDRNEIRVSADGHEFEEAVDRLTGEIPSYTLLARHTGKAKIATTKEGDRVLTLTLNVVAQPESFAGVAGTVMRLLGEVSENTDMLLELKPLARQRRLL